MSDRNTKEQVLAELRQMLAELDETERREADEGAALAAESEQAEDLVGPARPTAPLSLRG